MQSSGSSSDRRQVQTSEVEDALLVLQDCEREERSGSLPRGSGDCIDTSSTKVLGRGR